MLPKCVLPSLKRKGRHSRPTPIVSLCECWSRNELESIWKQAKEPLQLGVACASGAEKIMHGLSRCVEDHWSDNDFAVI